MLTNFAFYFAELCKNTHFTEKRLFLCIQKMLKWGACSLKNEGKSVFRDAKTFISRTFHRHTDFFGKFGSFWCQKSSIILKHRILAHKTLFLALIKTMHEMAF